MMRLTRQGKQAQLAERFCEQGGLCYYCLRETFNPNWEKFEAAAIRFDMSRQTIILRMATREHLIKRQDGGTDQDFNIVMACFECNTQRDDRSVLKHVKFCRQRYLPHEDVFVVAA